MDVAHKFKPAALDVDQWVRSAVGLGATEACLTAHHDGGFALWPTLHTGYGVRQASGWRGGHGDVLREFSAACARHNVSMCFYVSELLDCWEAGDEARALCMCTCTCTALSSLSICTLHVSICTST